MPECALCGADRPSTQEDVLPEWLRRHAIDRSDGASFKGFVGGRAFEAPVPFKVLTPLCEPCNQWSGRTFEAPAKPILSDLIDGRPRSLAANEQVTIGRWALKTILIDGLRHADRPDSDVYREFWETEDPPPASTVFLGRYTAHGTIIPNQHVVRKPVPTGAAGPPERCTFMPAMFIFGELLILANVHIAGRPHRPVDSSRLLRVWPGGDDTVHWPPPLEMDASRAASASFWELDTDYQVDY
jgi:hypothetical protein